MKPVSVTGTEGQGDLVVTRPRTRQDMQVTTVLFAAFCAVSSCFPKLAAPIRGKNVTSREWRTGARAAVVTVCRARVTAVMTTLRATRPSAAL